MKNISKTLFAAAYALALTAPAWAGPSEDLAMIIKKHWEWHLKENPMTARSLGRPSRLGDLGDASLSHADKNAADAKAFADQLRAIPDAGLSSAERTNKGVLLRLLDELVEGNSFGQRMVLFTTYDGWHQAFAGASGYLPFKTKTDYDYYLAALAAYPKLNGEAISISRRAVNEGFAQPCEAMGGFEKTIRGAVSGDAEKTRFYEPFTRRKPDAISDADWAALKAKAVSLITGTLKPEYEKLYTFYLTEYKPNCAKTVGVSAQPKGREYYAYRARVHTTTNLTPDEIHQIGLGEVDRIKARMDKVAKDAGYSSREAMIKELRTNPKYFPKSAAELISYASTTAKQIDGKMPGYFKTLPRLPYGIKTIPAETAETTTSAYYNPGAPDIGIAGNYFVNTSKLNQRPLWEYAALTAHESVPGHHHQIALQQELPLPDFRKYAAGFTAFVEGWALYTEYLGEEMGLYDTPEKMMGRLSFEMWRASRLVVDTGMHTKGWTKARAIAFMRENTALTEANIEAEVNRYISWPGQALGYKIGEIKIRQLRSKAQAALGNKFDLGSFHDAVLLQGPVPLNVLEQQIDDWIVAAKAKK